MEYIRWDKYEIWIYILSTNKDRNIFISNIYFSNKKELFKDAMNEIKKLDCDFNSITIKIKKRNLSK